MGVDIKGRLAVARHDAGRQAGRDEHPVADAPYVDDELDGRLPGGPALDNEAPQVADHARRAFSWAQGAAPRWQMASARASAVSAGPGTPSRPIRRATISCTCSLVALP